ncbi:MAG: T9SS type A sorting domain-containing protein [Flavobacteriales bacterium]|nr:T9SS type A sorting domain-containing protein [Flavobacteriales bacterium]
MVRLVFIAVILVGMVKSIPAGTSAFLDVSVEQPIGDVKVYPNPFQSEFTIDLSKFSSDVQITVSDLLGKEIYRKHVTNKEFLIIELTQKDLRSGIYIVNLKSMEQSISKRIIKM